MAAKMVNIGAHALENHRLRPYEWSDEVPLECGGYLDIYGWYVRRRT
jgi:hypothetical protein